MESGYDKARFVDERRNLWGGLPSDGIVRRQAMFALFINLLASLRSAFRARAELVLENLALRQQLATLRRSSPRPRHRLTDRTLWLGLSQIRSRWSDALVIVKPDTVVGWHRAGFRLFCRWESRSCTPAEDAISPEVKNLIRRMAKANVTWGAPRIHGELLKLGFQISERSVSRFMPKKPRKPPSQTWRSFLDNHLGSLASVDFFTVVAVQGRTRGTRHARASDGRHRGAARSRWAAPPLRASSRPTVDPPWPPPRERGRPGSARDMLAPGFRHQSRVLEAALRHVHAASQPAHGLLAGFYGPRMPSWRGTGV